MSAATIEQSTVTEAEAPTVRFKRKKGTDEWILTGPASLVSEGPVTVTKMNGQTSVENVLSVGSSFDKDGVLHRYGYLRPKAEGTAPRPASPALSQSEADFVPDDFQPSADVDFMPGGDAQDTADWDF